MDLKFCAVGALLAVCFLTTVNASYIEKRGVVIPAQLPGSWVSQGCYVDIGRTLTQGGFTNATGMTDESCIAYCSSLGYIYAGTEYSEECYCGNTLAPGSGPAATGDCNMACTGNATEACGGPNRLNLFWSGTSGPQTNPGFGNWLFAGCYAEGTSGRTLPNGVTTTGGTSKMTVDLCTSACQAADYVLAGVEYSGECWCGNAVANGGVLASDGLTGCNMLCNGNLSEYCGGSNRLDVYDYNHAVSLPPYTTTSATSTTSSMTSTTATSKSTTSSLSNSKSSSVTTSSTSTKLSTTSKSFTSTSTSSRLTTSSTSSTSSLSTSSKSSSTSTSLVSTSSSSSSTSHSISSSSSRSSTISASSTTSISTTISASSATSISTTSRSSSTISSSTTPTPTLGIKQSIGAYNYIGCYTEGNGVRALSGAAFYNYTIMTLDICAVDCAGYTYWGVEYGGECYCGNTVNAGSALATNQGACNFVCPGNSYEYCGAGNLLDMYQFNGTVFTSSSIISASTTSTSSVSTSTPVATSLPTGWSYQGCYVDGTNGRILNYQVADSTSNSVESCVQQCVAADYTIAGMEYSVQCFCGDAIYNGGVLATNQGDCNMPCGGNSAETCGAGNRMSLYSDGKPQIYQPPGPQKTGLPANWAYVGCLQDNILSSNGNPPVTLTTFPYQVWTNETGNTPVACIEQCQLFGYNAAGLEYGSQCFCGDVENIQVASAPSALTDPTQAQYYIRSAVPQIVPDSQCADVCTGNSSYYCGDNNLLSYYAWVGEEPLYNWNIPQGNAAGEYSLLIGGVVVPLMTSQVITGKVTFIEKSAGTGEPNGTGAYELDLSEISNFSAAWRTMAGLQTDVFCSAGLTLPDLAGRQLTVAGWNGDSNFGIRLYWPDGSAGVPGTNEWVEDPSQLQLQVARWYPSAMIMANGSILVVGGEIGSNDPEQPTLEILPATGVPDPSAASGYSNTTVYLDFLETSAPFNLYPFLAVVPSGIFIAYYNEARILDEKTFQTITQLPNMPGAVNDPTGGRSYQLEGSMVILPQYPPYNAADITMLICGGSTSDGGYAIDNCVSTQPEAINPTWTIERMPSRRVMPCIAGLPDGTYLILNGGQHGVAGFGLGGSPNLNAVLYDPSKQVNSRMSIMANTTVARLYHSEAIVLLDGRVMVSGSDPTGDYVNAPTDEFPEEYRVEVFTPPYLLSGLPQPTFSIANKDWAYGKPYSFTVTSGAATAVSLLGSVVSTHGNSMGQRTIFPAISCTGNSCTVTSPPNAHTCPPGWYMMFVLDGPTPSVGQFVRIGGDPASLGNWPNITGSGFVLPGVKNPV